MFHAEGVARAKALRWRVGGELMSFKKWKGSQSGWSRVSSRDRPDRAGAGDGKAPRVMHPHPG